MLQAIIQLNDGYKLQVYGSSRTSPKYMVWKDNHNIAFGDTQKRIREVISLTGHTVELRFKPTEDEKKWYIRKV